jgi:hypothetical protein
LIAFIVRGHQNDGARAILQPFLLAALLFNTP